MILHSPPLVRTLKFCNISATCLTPGGVFNSGWHSRRALISPISRDTWDCILPSSSRIGLFPLAREREHGAISRHLFPPHEGAKTSEGLLDIRLTFFSSAAYFFRAGAPSGDVRPTPRNGRVRYFFEDYALDTDRRELRRGADVVPTTPQVFDLLDYLIRNREHVVSKDDLVSAIWKGRIVSDAALTTRLNAARSVIGDSGDEQRLIKTLPRKGFRFVGAVHETNRPSGAATVPDSGAESSHPLLALPDKPSIAVLPFQNMSGDTEQEYFADGIVEEITTALSRFRSLFVIARNSASLTRAARWM